MRKALVYLLVVAGLVGAFFVAFGSSPAAAKSQPCWKKLLADWRDGRIDGDYPAKCYSAAIKHAPEDLRQYGDLPSDLTRALQVAPRDSSGEIVLHNTAGHRSNAKSDTGGGDANANNGRNLSTKRSKQDPPKSGPVSEAIKGLGRSGDSSIPLPLLALGALALLLIAAGCASFVARRIQAHRRATPPGAP